jgi:hypothetical protein
MTVDEYAELLLGTLELVSDGYYQNKFGQTGYRAIYRSVRGFCWYSVSGTEVAIAPDEVARAITDQDRNILRENSYLNGNYQPGFEATVSAAEHSFMLNAAPEFPGL